ncbi:FAD-dependent thymidylate synthase [bacterium]|nr:FAD-dependent thymidylate synthase [bacterium]
MDKKLFLKDNIGFVELLETFGDDLTVVNAARVSFSKESSEVSNRDVKLINYLADHHHVTPFFHPMIRFRIKMPIFIVREWYRHTIGFARNEVSRRYVFDEPEIFIPQKLRARDKNLKQGSKSEAVTANDHHVKQMQEYCKQSLQYYNQLLDDNVCPEQARMILPQSMYTEFIETASLAGYARLVKLRVDATAQKEIQIYAHYINNFLEKQFPASWSALMKNTIIKEKENEYQTGHVDKKNGNRSQNDSTIL